MVTRENLEAPAEHVALDGDHGGPTAPLGIVTRSRDELECVSSRVTVFCDAALDRLRGDLDQANALPAQDDPLRRCQVGHGGEPGRVFDEGDAGHGVDARRAHSARARHPPDQPGRQTETAWDAGKADAAPQVNSLSAGQASVSFVLPEFGEWAVLYLPAEEFA